MKYLEGGSGVALALRDDLDWTDPISIWIGPIRSGLDWTGPDDDNDLRLLA